MLHPCPKAYGNSYITGFAIGATMATERASYCRSGLGPDQDANHLLMLLLQERVTPISLQTPLQRCVRQR
jgi:hypothetical protein